MEYWAKTSYEKNRVTYLCSVKICGKINQSCLNPSRPVHYEKLY